MKLVYLWIKKFRHIENKGFSFSSQFDILFETQDDKIDEPKIFGRLTIKQKSDYVDIYPDNISITGIIGKNGTGKTSILELLQDCSKADLKDQAIFMIFCSNDKIILNGIKTIDKLPQDFHIDYFNTATEISLTTLNKMDLTSISYKNTLDEPADIIYNNEEFLENKYNISSSYLLNQMEKLKVKSYQHIYNKYYSNDVLRAITLFKSSDVSLPFPMPKDITISCNNMLSKRNTKIFLEIFEHNEYVDDVYDKEAIIDNLISSVKSMGHEHNDRKLIELLEARSRRVSSYKELTLVEAQDMLEKLDRIPPEVYLNFSNPLKLIYQAVENIGSFNDLLLLNILNNYLVSTSKSAPYRPDILIEVCNYLKRIKQEFVLDMEVRDPRFNKKRFDAILSNYREYLFGIYGIVRETSTPTDETFFYHADKLIATMDNLVYVANNKTQESIAVDLKYMDRELMDSYQKLVFVGDNFLSFDWFPRLSSGQLSHVTFFSRLYQLLKYPQEYQKINKNILLLIDEGDLTLHPAWQKTYITWLVEFLSKNFTNQFHFHIIITSHSSFISSDLFKNDQIFLTHNDDFNKIEIFNTFGANIHTLLSSKFYMNGSLMGEYAQNVITDLIGCLNQDDDSECKYTQIEMKNIIGKIGEDFLRHKLFDMYEKKYKINIEKERLTAEYKRIEKRLEELSNA